MSLNINAGELRHLIEFYEQGEGTDNRGRPVARTLAFDPVMGDLRYKSGDQIRNSGAQLTDEVITVLTWYDPRVTNAMFIKYNDLMYEVNHIKPDSLLRGMIITAEVERDG
mgnify:CR=1 FL=1|tara:strand:+ start:290 stop:622 length:333 start_codon:yes stop_codon:yes gene_type:complete